VARCRSSAESCGIGAEAIGGGEPGTGEEREREREREKVVEGLASQNKLGDEHSIQQSIKGDTQKAPKGPVASQALSWERYVWVEPDLGRAKRKQRGHNTAFSLGSVSKPFMTARVYGDMGNTALPDLRQMHRATRPRRPVGAQRGRARPVAGGASGERCRPPRKAGEGWHGPPR